MFKKNHRENVMLTESDGVGECVNDNDKLADNILARLIGPINVKKWHALKIVLSSKTNEEFVTKLLEIAQEFLDRQGGQLENVHAKKQKSLNKKQKLISSKVIHNGKSEPSEIIVENVLEDQNSNNESNDNNEIDAEKQEVVLPKPKSESNKPSKKVTKKSEHSDSSKSKVYQLNDRNILPLKDIHISENLTSEINTKKNTAPESDQAGSQLDKIKIKLCHYCNTHHIQDQCPINFPHYIINDALNTTSWKEKFKTLYEISSNKDKNEVNGEIVAKDCKYSYSTLSLPSVVHIKETNTPHGLGAFTKSDIEPFTQFGPLVGEIVKEMDIAEDVNMKYIWEINADSGHLYFHTESTVKSNWLRFVRPAPTRDERNLSVISKDSKLYFVSTKFIKSETELLYWQDCQTTANRKKMEKTTCGGCNMDFSHPHYYRIHCSLFHDVRYSLTIKKYHCKVCGAAVLGKENIMKHAAELHNGQGAYQCQFCKKFFMRLNYLEMHRTYGCSANPHRSRPLCDFCGKKFCQPQKLKVHIKRMHSDISQVLKEFQCKNCLKILGSRAALQRHSKEVHQKQTEGQCSCSRCGKRFQNKSNLKIHMLTHSGIKPFKCNSCDAAFTTKQCLQFHYKKVHNFTEDNMPKIERSIDYTFQAYSGAKDESDHNKNESSPNQADRDTESDNGSMDSENIDDPKPFDNSPSRNTNDFHPNSPMNSPFPDDCAKSDLTSINGKVLSKGSKKWIGDELSAVTKLPDIYSVERLSKEDLSGITLQGAEMYEKNKLSNISDFGRHEASNASLLVEAALDSVCHEPNIDIDVSSTPNCTDSLVNNLYNLTQPDSLADVNYNETCINDSRDINLMSPSVNDRVSVTDEFNEELRQDDNISMHYPNFHQNDFSPPHSPDIHRSNFVRNYINSLSPQNSYEQKNNTPVPSPPRYDFGHAVNPEHLSSDDSNGMTVQNLSLNDSKNGIQLDLSLYKSYKHTSQDYVRKLKFATASDTLDQDHVDVMNQDLPSSISNMESDKELVERDDHPKYSDELSAEIRNKFELDLDMRLKGYDSIDSEILRQRNHTYESGELDFRNKTYDLIDQVENRNKPYDGIESDFRTDRSFEPIVLNSSEMQGLDMSARSFHNYPNINRYHPLYPDVDRVDLRLNYSPPPPTYTHADILRAVSLDLTSPGRHSVDLSLRNHPLHQIANSRLLTEHGLQPNPHRLLDQSRLLGAELTSTRHLNGERMMADASSRILTDHSTSRILNNEQLSTNHLLNSEQNRLLSDESRLLGDGRILGSSTSGGVSPVQGFSGYSISQNPYHPTPIPTRPHVTSPTPAPYHYPAYY
nr:uncharacterized protein LOC111507948 [Leptinotarsa decemlineata]